MSAGDLAGVRTTPYRAAGAAVFDEFHDLSQWVDRHHRKHECVVDPLFRKIIGQWRDIARTPDPDWDVCAEMIANTDPVRGLDLPLSHFAGRIEGAGRVTLTTMHSAKGREFDAVILYGVNAYDMPSRRDQRSPAALRDARRSFYVAVTRPRKELCLVFQEHHHSPWIAELAQRMNEE